jgi:hypothetical protein
MCKQSDTAKLLAIGLLNYADDDGYFYADAKLVRNAIRPMDDDSGITTVALRELSSIGFISVRTHPTHGEIGFIESFKAHQVINKHKSSIIKELYDYCITTVALPDADRPEWNGMEGNGKEGNPREARPASPSPLPDELAKQQGFLAEWEQFKSHRKKKRAPMTARAEELILATLAERPLDAVYMLQTAQTAGWTGIEWAWLDNRRAGNKQSPNKPTTTLRLGHKIPVWDPMKDKEPQ